MRLVAAHRPSPDVGISYADTDAVKGLLIACIVLGHNSIVSDSLPVIWTALYAFHVTGFLLLPFLHPSHPASRRFALDRAVRYGVPFIAFFLFAAALNAILFRRGDPPVDIIRDVAWGLLVTTSTNSRIATGFALYWFLPTLFCLVIARALLASWDRSVRVVVFVSLLALHGFVGMLPDEIRNLIPLNLPIVVYVFPLGLIASELWHRRYAGHLQQTATLTGALAIGTMLMFLAVGGRVNLASLNVYSLATPLMLLLADTVSVTAFLAIAASSPALSRSRVLCWLGRSSLIVYLIHALVFQALLRITPAGWVVDAGSASSIATGIVLFIFTLFISGILAEVPRRVAPMRRVLLPRTWAEWRLTGGGGSA